MRSITRVATIGLIGLGSVGAAAPSYASGSTGTGTATVAMTAAATTGCDGFSSNTTAPSTIRVLRTSTGTVQTVSFRSYVADVLAKEWYPSWNSASLRAGAMAIKTYAWYFANHSGANRHNGVCYDVDDSPAHYQIYVPGSATASTTAAVSATWSTRMTKSNTIFAAYYCSTANPCPTPGYLGGSMSQWGSKSLGDKGYTWQNIVKYYYGSTVQLTGSSTTTISNLADAACPSWIQQGQTSACVVRLQKLLNSKQGSGLVADGIFGAQTATAVKRWQSAHHLVADAIVGAATKASIDPR
ncbi:SpoIID/LytB domain-containing protein [Calidifontibacter terrae]